MTSSLQGRRDDVRPLQSEAVTVRISRLRLEHDDEPEATCHGQRLPSCRVSDVAVLGGFIEPPTVSASEEPIMSTASTALTELLTSSRQQPPRGDDIGSLCRNASPSWKGAFSCSVINLSIAQHARFIATTIYRTYEIVVTSARLTSHSSGPSSFTPTSGACLGPNGPRRCRRGGRGSIIGDALISPARSSRPRAYLGGSPRPRPRPPEISTCCGLSRPVVVYRAAHHRASCLDCHGLAPSPVRAAYCLRASLLSRATP